jgi:predicted nucleotidyltransferase
MMNGITIDKPALAEFCERSLIRRPSVLGSSLRDDLGADSGMDAFVDLDAAAVAGLIKLAGRQSTLTDLMSREVGLGTPRELNPLSGKRVQAEAEVQSSV